MLHDIQTVGVSVKRQPVLYLGIYLLDPLHKMWSALCSPGCLGTAGALIYGLRAFHQGKTRQSQMLMRGRILAQGFTVVAIIFGVFATALKPKQWRRTNPTPVPSLGVRPDPAWNWTVWMNWIMYDVSSIVQIPVLRMTLFMVVWKLNCSWW